MTRRPVSCSAFVRKFINYCEPSKRGKNFHSNFSLKMSIMFINYKNFIMIKMRFLKFAFLLLFYIFIPLSSYGYEYYHLQDGFFSSIHVLIIDPKESPITAVKAQKRGRETVAAIVREHQAIAGINGGFWKEDGRPAGILKIGAVWYGTPTKPRGAVGWSEGGQRVVMDRVLTDHSLKNKDENIKVLPLFTDPKEWDDLENIVGGTPLLIFNGKVLEDYSSEQTLESFLTKRHPRTAVGIKLDGNWVFVVVDGRIFGFFGGMTIKELADFMHSLGCIEALNLDGGGSSTMVLEGHVINEPSGSINEDGKKAQAVSDAILVMPKGLP